MKRFAISALITTALLSSQTTLASETDGAQLHDENCTTCHNSSTYTRENRRVKSMEALGRQVRMCRDNIGLTWFDDEVDAVIKHLNDNYYKF